MKKLRVYIFSGWLAVAAALCTMIACGGDDGLPYDPDSGTDPTEEPGDGPGTEISDDYVYELPVIFHVFYRRQADKTQYVPASRLQTIINNVNELYAGNVYGYKDSENIGVKFVLATTDEDGNRLKTPGVDYIAWQKDSIDVYAFMSDETGKYHAYLWEPNKYINIMLYHFIQKKDDSSVTLGVSNMPYSLEGDGALEGLHTVSTLELTKYNIKFPYCVSINSKYIFQESDRYYLEDKGYNGYTYNSQDVNATLAHELGHYLGLHHIFTEKDSKTADDCDDTDYCDDTPSYNRVAYNNYVSNYLDTVPKNKINLHDLLKRTDCGGDIFESANLMDYSVSWADKFSTQQRARMRKVLTTSPLMPGPKINRKTSSKKARKHTGVVSLPIVLVE